MSQLTNIDNNLCVAKFPCPYRKANLCIFRVWEEAVLETLAKSDPENRTCYQGIAGVLVNPCLEQDEEEHNRSVTDIPWLYTLGHNPNGEVRNL